MRIAVIGGGINGLCISGEAARRGANVILFEENEIMRATSSATSKLLHGGLRYLENFEFKLVREALKERNWWIENVPDLVHPVEIHLPIYKSSLRSKAKVKAGLWLYDMLAGSKNIQRHRWHDRNLFCEQNKQLKSVELNGGFVFYDGQMFDYELGCWVAKQAVSKGVRLNEQSKISKLDAYGCIHIDNGKRSVLEPNIETSQSELLNKYDFVINASGSFAEQLLIDNGITPKYQIDHIRGSHLIIDQPLSYGYLFEVPKDKRVFFVLPYKNQTLLGTTEIRQILSDPIQCSSEETEYLISAYNHYFIKTISKKNIVNSFTGLRPLIKSRKHVSKASREYAIQQNNKLITIYGGKWTTARVLANHVCDKIKLEK